jgi:hypothetical protein
MKVSSRKMLFFDAMTTPADGLNVHCQQDCTSTSLAKTSATDQSPHKVPRKAPFLFGVPLPKPGVATIDRLR